MRDRYPDPIALVANHQTQSNSVEYPQQISLIHQTAHSSQPYLPTYKAPHHPQQYQHAYQPQISDDPIAFLNKATTFLSTVVASRFSYTNNQIRRFSNPRNQATLQDGGVIVQQVRGRQDPGNPDGQAIQTTIPQNVAFQTDDLDPYDFRLTSFLITSFKPKSEQLDIIQTSVEIEVPKELPKHVDSVPANVLTANYKCLVNDNLEVERLEQENDHLFELLLSQDIVHICVNSLASRNDCREMQQDFIDEYNENLMLNAELAKKGQMVVKIIFDEVVFKCSRLKIVMLDAKDVSIANLRNHIESLKGTIPRWKLTGRTFTIVGNTCPLTRITSTKVVPLKKTISKSIITQNPEVKVVQIVIWYLDSGCSKHMTGNHSQLTNFVQKFMGTVRFNNDQISKIMSYGDYHMGNVMISQVYYVEGLGDNLCPLANFVIPILRSLFVDTRATFVTKKVLTYSKDQEAQTYTQVINT
nr:integrase, catalytic region, zinc finger, CCHC-type, peptidase aspartic, catalytic [Tanacetum cinerariifolium]